MRQEPTPGGPHRLHPPLRASGPGGSPVRNGTAFPAQEAEETQGTLHAGGPQPFRGPARVAFPVSGPSSSSGPPAPGPPLCPVQPCPPPASALLNKRKAYSSVSSLSRCRRADRSPGLPRARAALTGLTAVSLWSLSRRT